MCYVRKWEVDLTLIEAPLKGLHREEAEATKAMNPKARKGKKR